jgi:hypothetical protein
MDKVLSVEEGHHDVTVVISVTGTIVRISRVSARLCFVDLADVVVGGNEADEKTLQTVQLIAKSVDHEADTEARWDDAAMEYVRRLKLYDTVRCAGSVERTNGTVALHAHSNTLVVVSAGTDAQRQLAWQRRVPPPSSSLSLTSSPSSALSSSGERRPVCKTFVNSGRCPLADDECSFYHPQTDAELKAERSKWVAARLHAKRERSQLSGDAHDAHGKQPSFERAGIFADWLVETMGESSLRRGSGVVDVAGGRGDVSFALCTERGIACTLVDPRPQKLSRRQHKWLRKRRKTHARVADDGGGDGDGVDGGGGDGDGEGVGGAATYTPPPLAPQLCELFDADGAFAAAHAVDVLQTCSAFVGMHADEATEAIVDAAVAYGKACAVVPCCIFPKLFPNRVLRDGTAVGSSFDLFIRYLLEKHPRLQSTFLNFDGKNQVVYLTPENAAGNSTANES